ncbi:MAG: class I SAM-dependent methyltransferase [Chloroflexi bacterium]|nr:class I SAM-dependent methyltransferase [Chloroflexota bacterium]
MEQIEYEIMASVEAAHWWYRGMRAISAAWLDLVYGQRRDLRVLDTGCGTGGNGEFLQRYGCVTGLDLSALALKLGQQRLPGKLVRGSVVTLPFADAAFDLVTSFDVLYHRAVIDESAALAETLRVLRPGGRFLVRLPAYRWLSSKHDRSVHGRYRYTGTETRAMLTGAGFVIERLSYINSLLFPVVLLQRLGERVLPQLEQSGSDLELPSPLVNYTLQTAMYSEAAWLRDGGRFPFGLSILALARKPG